jgi:acyl-CoA reductase-like NAD-dependent aldehyde dehydrogenase
MPSLDISPDDPRDNPHDYCNNLNVGPILPIMAVDSIGEAIEYINSHDKPLAL